jgi:ribosomal protein S18 acetylase RimI-like enzyme
VIGIRRARATDARAIGAVQVAAWRSAYPGILPDAYLAGMSAARQAAHYDAAIHSRSGCVFVATASGVDVPEGTAPQIVGFVTAGPARWRDHSGQVFADGEVETLYVLDDWRERGLGRRLLRAAASSLADAGCRSVFLWVLRDNPSRWFYQRLGGRKTAETIIRVGGAAVVQTAFVWDPIERLLEESARAG